jgi:uncharacterized membrane protein YkvI
MENNRPWSKLAITGFVLSLIVIAILILAFSGAFVESVAGFYLMVGSIIASLIINIWAMRITKKNNKKGFKLNLIGLILTVLVILLIFLLILFGPLFS